MPRIPLPTYETATPEQRAVWDAVVKGPRGSLRGPLLAALHRPELADKWQQIGELLRYRTSLPPRISELAILVTARHLNCQFEWYAHEPPARKAGLADDVIEAMRHGKKPRFEKKDEEDVHAYSVEMHQTHKVAQATYDRVLAAWKPAGVVELTALLGYYTMVAMTLNAHEIPLPPDTKPPLPEL